MRCGTAIKSNSCTFANTTVTIQPRNSTGIVLRHSLGKGRQVQFFAQCIRRKKLVLHQFINMRSCKNCILTTSQTSQNLLTQIWMATRPGIDPGQDGFGFRQRFPKTGQQGGHFLRCKIIQLHWRGNFK